MLHSANIAAEQEVDVHAITVALFTVYLGACDVHQHKFNRE